MWQRYAWILVFSIVAVDAQAQSLPDRVRALGRQEQPGRIEELVPVLSHERTDVRREAANALGQSRRRDTGDAQVFINLLDNPSLDHEFTIFGEVTSGLDVVDAVLEGDVIARIEVP